MQPGVATWTAWKEGNCASISRGRQDWQRSLFTRFSVLLGHCQLA